MDTILTLLGDVGLVRSGADELADVARPAVRPQRASRGVACGRDSPIQQLHLELSRDASATQENQLVLVTWFLHVAQSLRTYFGHRRQWRRAHHSAMPSHRTAGSAPVVNVLPWHSIRNCGTERPRLVQRCWEAEWPAAFAPALPSTICSHHQDRCLMAHRQSRVTRLPGPDPVTDSGA